MRPRSVLIVCALVAVGVAGYALLAPSGAPRLRTQERELAGIEQDVQALNAQNDALREQAKRLRGDNPAMKPYLEQAVRDELGYVRPDEHIVLTGNQPAAATPDSGRTGEDTP